METENVRLYGDGDNIVVCCDFCDGVIQRVSAIRLDTLVIGLMSNSHSCPDIDARTYKG